jgi:hypothetical protein
MTNKDIINQINKIRANYLGEKDGGRTFISSLAKEFNSYEENGRNLVIDFFIHELQIDRNGMRSFALPVFEEMEATEAASRIYETYLRFLKSNDEKWEEEIVTTLLKLRFTESKEFYSKYIDKSINEKTDNGYVFFLGVLYCRVEPDKGLDILSDYFCKHLAFENENEEMVAFFKNRMGFLVGNFSKKPVDLTPKLIQQAIKKNKVVGKRLIEILLYYLQSDLVKDYSEEFVNEKITILNSFNI